MWSGKSKSQEFIRLPKDEWEQHRGDVEDFVKRYESSLKRIKDLVKENSDLKEKLNVLQNKLASDEQKVTGDIEQTSMAIKKMRADISRLIQQTEKEIGKG